MQTIQNALPATNRRVIGPIPPRDDRGRLKIGPLLQKQAKRNILGEPLRDDNDQPIEEMVDTRPERHYMAYDGSQVAAEGATKGLRLFAVDYGIEPILKVWARDREDALDVFKREWGIVRFSSEMDDAKVTPIQG